MDPREFPTKGNLMLAKNSLALANQGYELMDKKRNILLKELMGLIDEAKGIQEEIDSTFTQAYVCLQRANIEMGISRVQEFAFTVPIEDSIRIQTRSIMGTEIPHIKYDEKQNDLTYSLGDTGESLDITREAFRKVKNLTIKLAEVENSAYRLATNIKKTQKRANALKNITIPMYTNLVYSINNALEEKEREEFFYEIRQQYNSYKIDENETNVKRASEFIFLNRTCFNGLYRVNKNGEFNVPCGKYKNPTICDANNLRNLSYLIRNVKFQYGDYKKSKEYIDCNTFVYFDPPYRPLSNTSGFTSYTKEDFNDENQKELACYFRELDEKDAKLMLSNSNPKNTNENDNFFEEIYKGYNINEISAKRMINADVKGRGEISELLITNYKEMDECIQENSILKKVVLS